VWGADGAPGAAADHAVRVASALDEPGVTVVATPVDVTDLAVLEEVAGPVVAWTEPMAGSEQR
jgi:hypothetical protein